MESEIFDHLSRNAAASTKEERVAAEARLSQCVSRDTLSAICAMLAIAASPVHQRQAVYVAQLAATQAKNALRTALLNEADVTDPLEAVGGSPPSRSTRGQAAVDRVLSSRRSVARLRGCCLQHLPTVNIPAIRRLFFEVARLLLEGQLDTWPEYITFMLTSLSRSIASGSADDVLTCLQGLYVATKPLKKIGAVTEDHHQQLADAVLPLLPPCMTVADNRVTHIALKVFECFVAQYGVEPRALAGHPALWAQWLETLLQLPSSVTARLGTHVNTEAAAFVIFAKCIKRLGAISFGLVSQAVVALQPDAGELASKSKSKKALPTGMLSTASNQLYASFITGGYAARFAVLWSGWLMSVDVSGPRSAQLTVLGKGLNFALRYLRSCRLRADLYACLPLPSLVCDHLVRFLPYTDEEAEAWDADAKEFLRQQADPANDDLSVRAVTMHTVLDLINPAPEPSEAGDSKPARRKARSHKAPPVDPQSMPAVVPPSHLYSVLHCVGTHLASPDPRAVDGCLYLLAQLSSLVMADPALAAQMEGVIAAHVLPRIASGAEHPSPFVRAKAAWVCGRYVRTPWTNVEQFASMLAALFHLLNDSQLLVRLEATTALCFFSASRRARHWMLSTSVLQPLAESCLYLIEAVGDERAVAALHYLISSFGKHISHIVETVAQSLVRNFLATLFDLSQLEATEITGERETKAEDTLTMSKMDGGAAMANELLKTLVSLLQAVHEDLPDHNEVIRRLQPIIAAMMRQTLRSSHLHGTDSSVTVSTFDLFETLATVFQRLLFYSSECGIGTECWEVLPLLCGMVLGPSDDASRSVDGAGGDDWPGTDNFSYIMPALDNFLSCDIVTFTRPECLPLVMRTVQFVMHYASHGGDLQQARDAALLLMSMLEHGAPAKAQLATVVPSVVGLALQALAAPHLFDGLEVQVPLCGVLLDGFILDAPLVLTAFDGQWPSVFPSLVTFLKKGRRGGRSASAWSPMDRKVAAVGLSRAVSAIIAARGVNDPIWGGGASNGAAFLSLAVEFCLANTSAYTKRAGWMEEDMAESQADDVRSDGGAIDQGPAADDEFLAPPDVGDGSDEEDGDGDAEANDDVDGDEPAEGDDSYTTPLDDVCEAAVVDEAVRLYASAAGRSGPTATAGDMSWWTAAVAEELRLAGLEWQRWHNLRHQVKVLADAHRCQPAATGDSAAARS